MSEKQEKRIFAVMFYNSHMLKDYSIPFVLLLTLLFAACRAPKAESEVDLAEKYAESRPELAIELLLTIEPQQRQADEVLNERYKRIWQEAVHRLSDRNMADSLQIMLEAGAGAEEMAQRMRQYLADEQRQAATDAVNGTAENAQGNRRKHSYYSVEMLGGGIFVLSLVTLAAIGFHFYDSRKNRIIAQQQQAIDEQNRVFCQQRTQSDAVIEQMEREVEQMRGQLRLAEERREEMHRHMRVLQDEREKSLQQADQILSRTQMLATRGERPTAEQWQQLMQLTDARYPDFKSRLLSAYPKCGDEAVRVCALTLLGFDSNDICILTDSYRQKLYKTRARITKNIVNQKLGNTDDFYHALKKFFA